MEWKTFANFYSSFVASNLKRSGVQNTKSLIQLTRPRLDDRPLRTVQTPVDLGVVPPLKLQVYLEFLDDLRNKNTPGDR